VVLGEGARYERVRDAVAARQLDPWSATDELLDAAGP
jgi:hypothetical protein